MSDNALKTMGQDAPWKSRSYADQASESTSRSGTPTASGSGYGRNLQEVVSRIADAESGSAQQPFDGKQKEWASTLLLVQEACESIRVSEERVEALETELEQAAIQSRDDLKQMLSRLQAAQEEIKAANARTKAAEARAQEAENWLARLNEAIVEGFGRPSGRIELRGEDDQAHAQSEADDGDDGLGDAAEAQEA